MIEIHVMMMGMIVVIIMISVTNDCNVNDNCIKNYYNNDNRQTSIDKIRDKTSMIMVMIMKKIMILITRIRRIMIKYQ